MRPSTGARPARRYEALRIVSAIYKALAAVVLAVFVVLAIAFATREGPVGFAVLLTLVYGFTAALFLYAFGELIYLAIAIEENTRSSAVFSKRQLAALKNLTALQVVAATDQVGDGEVEEESEEEGPEQE